jgi:hypothetical protein|tara:strand:+ start:90 stop:893 length:804 start_codon:yes stop_codon:yes gene_type:complete
MINIKIPANKSIKFIENFFIKKGLKLIVNQSKKNKANVNQMILKEPYVPELTDLYRLYQFILLNKRTTILEFGSGWSSLIFNLAINDLNKKYNNKVKNLRRNNPFELFILENEKKFLNITKKRINKFNKYLKLKKLTKIHYCYSEVEMTTFNNRIATQYKKLPLCNPDFIYLDGPDQFNVKKDVNGISTRHKDMMPMVCDILKLEYFFTPGTIIVCDGRAANAKFLKDNFKRNWKYFNDIKNDQHIFCLNDPILGKYNKLQINFYNK